MAMNDEQLIDYVRALTRARAVQVADRFDVELEDARNRLDALVDSGDLVVSDGFSPNGIACKVYDISSPRPEKYKPRVTSVSVTPNPGFITSLRPPPPELQGAVTKVQKALNYLTDKGEATVEDMRVVMDLDRHMSPTSYLGAAIRNGQIIKEGNTYRLGDGKPIGRNASRQPRPPTPITTSAPALAQQPESPASSSLRIGLWSDGVIELQRDGKTVACIDQKDGERLIEFLATAKVPRVA